MANPSTPHAFALGGTLFVPASHKSLDAILSGDKYPELRSVVIDFEDGLEDKERPEALNALENRLTTLAESKLLRFIRPQNPQMLEMFLNLKEIDRIDGFILPKFGLDNAHTYLSLMADAKAMMKSCFMPSIEGVELFNGQQLLQLRDMLLPFREEILCIRFGAEDMLRQLGIRRAPGTSLYDMIAPNQVVATLLNTFKPYGFDLSAPVFPNFSDKEGFDKEIKRELENGFVSKTIIHPDQIEPMNRLYSVSRQELDEARALLSKADGVMNLNGKMGEAKTQSRWAESVQKRAELFDVV